MDKQQILEIAKNDPRFSQAVLTLENDIGDMPITGEGLDELVQMLEFALNNPDRYPEIVQAAVQDDLVDPGDLPEQFDPVVIVSLLVLLYGMQERTKQKGFARGGLASMGRHGDTMLAHINPREAEMLRRMGGAGTINPRTGYPEYFSLKKFIKAALPIALMFIAPGLGTAIGSSLLGAGASTLASGMLGGAILGGGTAALTGGDWKKGMLMGGLGGGLGNAVGSYVAPGASQFAQSAIGGGLVGGVAGAATGQGFLKGAGQGALGGAIGNLAGGVSGPSSFEQGLSNAGVTFGNALTAGYDPKTAVGVGALSGVMTGLSYKPSDAVVDNLKTVKMPDGSTAPAPGSTATNAQGQTGSYQLDSATGAIKFVPNAGSYAVNSQTGAVEWKAAEPSFFDKVTKGGILDSGAPTTTGGKPESNISAGKIMGGLALASALSGAPPAAQEAIKKMTPEQQEYFNRPSVAWDWNKMQNDANTAGMSLDQFMSSNWPRITGYAQTGAGEVASQQGAYNLDQAPVVGKARGGALSAVARFAQGAGSGRADTIDAKLSDGEYVIDAETVAMLGDGSNKEGAKRLDMMRENIRSHKGKALSKGKFSPNAKSPLSYLKGVA